MNEGDLMKILASALIGMSLLAGCASTSAEPVSTIEVRTVEVQRPKPIVPSVDVLKLRPIEWEVITEDNVDAKLRQSDVFFALKTDGYENLSLNMSDIRATIEQYQSIIRRYERSYE